MTTVTKIEKRTETSWMVELSNGEFAIVKRRDTEDALYRLVSEIAQLPILSRLALMQLNQKSAFYTLVSTNNELIGNMYCQNPSPFWRKQEPILLEANMDFDSLRVLPKNVVFEDPNGQGFRFSPISLSKNGNTITLSTVRHFYVFEKMYR